MNLTDFEQTPIHRVFEFVKREAERYGVVPVSSEIVGLIPKLALGAGRGVVSASGELRFLADSGEPPGCGDERQNGRGRPARRSRAVHRAAGRAHGDSRRRQRGSGGARWPPDWPAWWRRCRAARKLICNTKASSAKRSPAYAAARGVEGRHRRRCRVLQRGQAACETPAPAPRTSAQSPQCARRSPQSAAASAPPVMPIDT
jgi:hypothetical protein